MKVLHINTYSGGGAGIACLRLHQALLDSGISSNALFKYVGEETRLTEGVIEFQHKEPFVRKVNRVFKRRFDRLTRKHQKIVTSGQKFEIFSTPLNEYRVEKFVRDFEPDIIHLHWISDFINFPSFFKGVDRPIVWTFHDMNPLFGGAHYEGDMERFKLLLEEVEEKYREIKRYSLSFAGRIHVVTPSKWLVEKSQHSELFVGCNHSHIPNCIDVETFNLKSKRELRQKYGILESTKVLLFVSQSVDNFRKGGDLLAQTVPTLVEKGVKLLVVGDDHSGEFEGNPDIRFLGRIKDQSKMAEIYALSDAYLLPSREDNFPNVMVESLLCGTPVLSFARGGMKDVIVDGVNGLLALKPNKASVKKLISDFFAMRPFDPVIVRNSILAQVEPQNVANKYIQIYKELIK